MPITQPGREKYKEAGEKVWACWVWHHLHPFTYLLKCTFWHKLSLLLHFCPTSIKSTPKMIICLRQIILRKAIYPITIPLLYPQSQASSLECVFVWICTQYTAYLFLPANIHVYTRAPLPFCQTFRIAICFQECICIIVWYHWTAVLLGSFSNQQICISALKSPWNHKMTVLLNIWAEGFPLKSFAFFFSAGLSFTCLSVNCVRAPYGNPMCP